MELAVSARSGRLEAAIVPLEDLSAAVRREMWTLFRRYYEAVTEETFLHDLSKKKDVIVLRDTGDGTLQGFSTLMVLEKTVAGRRVVAVFSGDTIIDDGYWGQTALQCAFFRYIVTRKLENPLTPVYWFLISKGYRTYLLLSRNFPEYWPRHDVETPPWQAELLDSLARELYPEAWRPELGLLKFDRCAGRLKGGVAPIAPSALEHADVAYFASKNPDHGAGDELCCLGRVNAHLFFSYPIRVAKKLLRRLVPAKRRLASRAAKTELTDIVTAAGASLRLPAPPPV